MTKAQPAIQLLAPHEKETIINFSTEGESAYVFTYQKRWQTHMRKLGAKTGLINGFGGVEYVVPKTWIRLPLPPRRGRKNDDD